MQKKGAVLKMSSCEFCFFLEGPGRHTLRHTPEFSRRSRFNLKLALSKTAGKKGGDETGSNRNHRETGKPCKSVNNSITEGLFRSFKTAPNFDGCIKEFSIPAYWTT